MPELCANMCVCVRCSAFGVVIITHVVCHECFLFLFIYLHCARAGKDLSHSNIAYFVCVCVGNRLRTFFSLPVLLFTLEMLIYGENESRKLKRE